MEINYSVDFDGTFLKCRQAIKCSLENLDGENMFPMKAFVLYTILCLKLERSTSPKYPLAIVVAKPMAKLSIATGDEMQIYLCLGQLRQFA